MNNNILRIGTLGFLIAIFSIVTMTAATTVNVGSSINAGSSTNSSTTVSSNTTNSNQGIISQIGSALSAGANDVASFFSNIWIRISTDLHI
jgi:hypothetical protein